MPTNSPTSGNAEILSCLQTSIVSRGYSVESSRQCVNCPEERAGSSSVNADGTPFLQCEISTDGFVENEAGDS